MCTSAMYIYGFSLCRYFVNVLKCKLVVDYDSMFFFFYWTLVCVCVCVCVSECSVVLDRTRTSAAGLTGIAMATACTELLPPSAW